MARNKRKASLTIGPSVDGSLINWGLLNKLFNTKLNIEALIDLMDELSQKLRAEPWEISQKGLDQLHDVLSGPKINGMYPLGARTTNDWYPDFVKSGFIGGMNQRQFVIYKVLEHLRRCKIEVNGPSSDPYHEGFTDTQKGLHIIVEFIDRGLQQHEVGTFQQSIYSARRELNAVEKAMDAACEKHFGMVENKRWNDERDALFTAIHEDSGQQ